MNENEFTYKGIAYVAIDGPCSMCAFNGTKQCGIAPYCDPGLRKDHRSIAWVALKDKQSSLPTNKSSYSLKFELK